MSSAISLTFAGLGAVTAAVGSGVLLARCFRAPRPDLIAWSIALLGLLISLGAQTLGYLSGYDGAMFRAMAIGGLVIAPLAVILGLSEIAGKGLGARFCARVYIPALAIVAVVVLYLDQLAGATFTKSWPNPHTFYQSPPNYVLYVTSVVTLLVTAIAAGVVMVRSTRRDWSVASTPQVAAGFAAILLAYPGLALAATYEAKQSLPLTTEFTPLLAIATGLILWSGLKFADLDIAALHAGRPPGRPTARPPADDAGDWRGDGYGGRDGSGRRAPSGYPEGPAGYPPDQTGDLDRYADSGYGGLYRPEPVAEKTRLAQPGPGDDEYGWDERGRYGEDDWRQDGSADDDRDPYGGGYETGDMDLSQAALGQAGMGNAGLGHAALGHPDLGHPDLAPGDYRDDADAGHAAETARKDLFGQIAIYTLLEDRVNEFDQLTQRVVEDVRGREPDTLVFIVHAVPSAPMQRILYEVYKDRAAYEWHNQQPYVTRFESDRRPYVLATNVIELGLQQAKVSPFPSVADLFGEPGYDTSGFERPDYLRDYGRPPASHGDSRSGGRW